MREEPNQWQVEFRRETRHLRQKLQQHLDQFYSELATSRLREFNTPEKKEAKKKELFQQFDRSLTKAGLSHSEYTDYLRAVRKIIHGALGLHGQGVAQERGVVQKVQENSAIASFNAAIRELDRFLRYEVPPEAADNTTRHLENLRVFANKLGDSQLAKFTTEEARLEKTSELMKAFNKIVDEIPRNILENTDMDAIKRDVKQIILEAFGPKKDIEPPASPRIKR